MASVFNLVCDGSHIITHIISKDREFEQERSTYHYAALLIQKIYRGHLARKFIRHLHESATIIQKYVRRYLVKINMANYMLACLENRAMRLYNKMASKIQAVWKGFIYRKNVLNFSKLYAERMRMFAVNREMMEKIKEAKKQAVQDEKIRMEIEAKNMVLFILFKLHHCIRTRKEGIYSIHESEEYSWIEKLLKSVKFTDYMKTLRKIYNESYKAPEEKPCMLKGRWRECEKAYNKRDRSKDLKLEKPRDSNDYPHDKPFCFDPRMSKKYEPYLLTQEEFRYAITMITRESKSGLNITKIGFDLTKRMVEFKSKIPPYHINFWTRLCEIHNFVED